MKETLRIIMVMGAAVSAAVLQSGWFSTWPHLAALDVVLIGTVLTAMIAPLYLAVIFVSVGSICLDYVTGWKLPGHLVVNFMGLAIWFALHRRVFATQTAPSAAFNAAIVAVVTTVVYGLLIGAAFISWPDQPISFRGIVGVIVVRVVSMGFLAGATQVIRRPRYANLELFRT